MTIELTLRDSELRYRRLFETAQDGILIVDAETGMIEDVNPYLIKMLGYSREEFVQKKLWEVGAFKDIEASKDAFEALQEKEYIRYENLPLKTKDGKLIEVEFVSNVYQVGSEQVIQCNIRNNTEHKRLILALRENEKKYFSLLNQSSDGIFIIDLAGNILTVNKAMCTELEFSEEEFLSMKVWDIFPEQYLEQYRQRLTKILAGESFEQAAEYEVRSKKGENHYVEVLSTPHYSGRHIVGFQGIARDVTARRQAEEALKQSEAKNRRLVEHLPTVVYTNAVDDASSTLYVSPQIETLLGYSAQEWLADPKLWSKTLHPEDRQHVLAQVAATNENKKPFEMEYRMIARDGRLVWVHDQIVLMNDLEGKGQLWQGIMLDITERKRAEEELYESEERFKNAFQYSAIGMALVSLEGRWLKVNPMLCSIVGYSEDELLTKTFQEITHPDDLNRDLNYVNQLLAGEIKSYKMEKRYFQREGRIVWVLLAVALARDNAGTPLYFISQIEDITERKQAEEELRESEQRYRQIFDTAQEGIWTIDAANRTTLANQRLADMLGYTVQEMLGKSIYEFMDEEGKAIAATGMENRRQGINEQRDFKYKHKDGSAVWALIETSTLLDHNQQYLGALAMLTDITMRKQAEERIQRQLEHLTAFREIDKAIAGSMNLRSVLETVLEHVITDLGVDAAVILLYDPHAQVLKYELGKGFRTNALQFTVLRVGEGYAGRAVLGGHTINIPNLQNRTTDFLRSPIFYQEGFVCYFGIPLIAKGEVKGVLEIFHRSALKADEEKLNFMETMAKQVAIAIDNATLYKDIQRSNVELSMAYDATIEGWSHALDLRDKETEGHSQRVTEITVNLARNLGLSEADLVQVRWGALLHDIGKMGVPDSILLKPGALTEEEWAAMRNHPRFAYDLLSPIRYLRLALDIPYCHHEKWDGTGYPRNLKGEQIPLTARIFAVVDVWDALRSDRPYRVAWAEDKVREHILALSGTHFDPQVVDVFLKVIE